MFATPTPIQLGNDWFVAKPVLEKSLEWLRPVESVASGWPIAKRKSSTPFQTFAPLVATR